MKQTNLSLIYGIGKKAYTKEYSLNQDCFLKPLQKQISLSFPLVTSVTLRVKKSKISKDLFSIYVGKELNLKNYNDYYIQKYDLDLDELERLRDAGFERVCLLNYKKYDLVLIGLQKDDIVVPDYYALKRNILNLEKLQSHYLKA